MDVKQGRDHLIEPRSHHRSVVTQGIIITQRRIDEAVAETGQLEISSKLINVELSPRPSSLCSVDGRFNLGGVKGPDHQPVVRRTTWSSDDVNCRWPVLYSGDDDIKCAATVLDHTSHALYSTKRIQQLGGTQRRRIARTVEAYVKIASDDVANDERCSSSTRNSSKKAAVTVAEPGRQTTAKTNELPATVTLAMRCSKVTGSNGTLSFVSLTAADATPATPP